MLSRPDSAAPALRRLRLLSLIALGTFVLVVAVITLWPGPPDPSGQSWLREFLRRGYDQGIPRWITFGRVEFVSNIVMFVPIGFFGALALSRHRWLILPLAGAASAAIEVIQAIALPQRDGTVRDVVSNTLGALVGYLMAAALVALVRRRASPRPPVPAPRTPAYR